METFLRALLNPPTSLSTAQHLGFFLLDGGKASSWVLLELPSELSNLLLAVYERTSRLGQTFFFGTLAFTPVLTRISYICRSPFKLHGFKNFLSYQLSTISPDSWYHSLRTPVPYFVPEGLFLTSDYLRMSKAAIRFASHSFPIFLCTPVFHHPRGLGLYLSCRQSGTRILGVCPSSGRRCGPMLMNMISTAGSIDGCPVGM